MKQIKLTKGLFTLVSDQDFEALNAFKWQASNESNGMKWYAVRFIYINKKKTKIRMHRQIMISQSDTDKVVDHLNGNSLDNRRENLEVVTQKENMKRAKGWKQKGEKYGTVS